MMSMEIEKERDRDRDREGDIRRSNGEDGKRNRE